MNKNICIYGGSYDPITYAHEMVLTEVSKLEWIDEIWVVLCRCRHDKDLAAFQHRHNMFSLIVNNISSEKFKNKIFLKDLECKDTATPTYDLLKTQKEIHPNYTFYFAIGSDLLPDIFNWDNGEKLVLENNFIIVERGNFNMDEEILKKIPNYHLIKIEKMSFVNYISSSDARKILTEKKNLEDLQKYINPIIIDYIKEHNLYEHHLK
ncbi:nicotinamide/nicotinic acid mononucleotide adenylyltransferase [Plasmodium brasilianum]|uniref:Nicotinate-nucleotide adenylyltransferase, putative n=2 Tax=Plasmodium (Plasmodium) TaxID=418103 RepID=A0A1A8WT73_PLAMA|nr:nicotinate-nucleotide adenylyltransferase, putative [Plasmodium malariae]KAI4836496.1 nicotinamide/nicotinic acid mononucleotide adenylyltransferase [Plasmodium brasilianum]SBS96154.1 nicotinate-nucleotide adenylyltransferase, putative [Plasmodium malariae]SBT80135.1 nicotinate-nucleotide adenylyltransferase, putative [Plasmodium malariae]SCO93772.1 nicotinate-nucleotide adenylyltransferase, putative [Plasmodium malariae]